MVGFKEDGVVDGSIVGARLGDRDIVGIPDGGTVDSTVGIIVVVVLGD